MTYAQRNLLSRMAEPMNHVIGWDGHASRNRGAWREYTDTGTPVPHGSVRRETIDALRNHGFITANYGRDTYKITLDGRLEVIRLLSKEAA